MVGHYGALRPDQPTTDWLPSRSGFDDRAFDALYRDVARFITKEARQGDAPRHRRNVGVERTEVEPSEAMDGVPALPHVVTANERAREALRSLPPDPRSPSKELRSP